MSLPALAYTCHRSRFEFQTLPVRAQHSRNLFVLFFCLFFHALLTVLAFRAFYLFLILFTKSVFVCALYLYEPSLIALAQLVIPTLLVAVKIQTNRDILHIMSHISYTTVKSTTIHRLFLFSFSLIYSIRKRGGDLTMGELRINLNLSHHRGCSVFPSSARVGERGVVL